MTVGGSCCGSWVRRQRGCSSPRHLLTSNHNAPRAAVSQGNQRAELDGLRGLVDDDHFKLQLLKDLMPAPGQRAAHDVRLQQDLLAELAAHRVECAVVR